MSDTTEKPVEKPAERPYILHMLTASPQMSPFDVNMAADAGYQLIVPYCNVEAGMVANLTQDAIFSRGPKGVSRTGIFIGGRDVMLAADMLDIAHKAMVPPFEVSVFADPSGAYTTAAALVALVERHLAKAWGMELEGIAGVNVVNNGKPIAGLSDVAGSAGVGVAIGIGALAIGNVKYQVEHRLFIRMRTGGKPVYLGFPEAFDEARAVAAGLD